jgi:hypothetical protein
MKRLVTKARSVFRMAAYFAALAAAVLLPSAAVAGTCQLNSAKGQIHHVIYVQFDNTHLRRDVPDVPSDLEQMPHLLDFVTDNGTMLTNDHTVLISHTTAGFTSTYTGLYPDRMGITVSNSYVRTSSTGTFSFPSAFAYWTGNVSAFNTPTVPNMIGPDGKNVPAPWVAFTRSGCDFGAVAGANIAPENTGTGTNGDIAILFGNPSPQFTEASLSNKAASGTAAGTLAQTDFVGFAIHCAQGSPICASGQNDLLPQEPNGYVGFMGLFGAKEINPVLTGGPVVTDLFGNPIADRFGQPGFPGFDGMVPAVSLAYVAAMQERGIPVTWAYISDAHDNHTGSGPETFGPGEAGYVQQLKSYDAAFAAFFARLAKDGITKDNTLFIFTEDEGDHFVGVRQTNCDGVTTPCVYGPNQTGEIDANIDTLVGTQFPQLGAQFLGNGASFAFTVHGDDAPPFYLAEKGAGALPETDPLTREFERDIATLTNVNPYTGKTDNLLVRMADQVGMNAIHMIAPADPARNATFVLFADDNYFITDFPSSTCTSCIESGFAWNHGDIQPEIAHTWLGFVGPGVRRLGEADVWTDHTDARPTILTLVGLQDDYVHDGRTIVEMIQSQALPDTLQDHLETLSDLGAMYKQINAPFGRFAKHALKASTNALQSGSSSDDSMYTNLESQIQDLTAKRDALASQMKTIIDGAEFHVVAPDEPQVQILVRQAEDLLDQMERLAFDGGTDPDITGWRSDD